MELDKSNVESMNHNLIIQLFYGLGTVLLIWYVNFFWKRQRLYKLASKFPGPKWLPIVGNSLVFSRLGKDIMQNMCDLFKHYSTPFGVWLGPTEFVVCIDKPEEIQTVLTSSKGLNKGELYRFMEIWLGNGLVTAPADIWKSHRKFINPTFHQKVLNTFVAIFIKKNEILVEKLKERVNKDNFNIFKYLSPCTLDIVCETMMGVDLNLQRENVLFAEQLDYAMSIINKRIFKPWLHFDFVNKLIGYEKEFKRSTDYINTFSDGIIEKKKRLLTEIKENPSFETAENKTTTRKGFLDLLLDMSEAESNLTDKEIRDEVNTMITAANESTANLAGYVFMILGIFPDIQEKVYQEIVDVIGEENRAITPEDLVSLTYMERVIKETMRYFPPIPIIARYLSGEIQLEKHLLPARCTVVFFTSHIHKSEKCWKHPLKFDPDRFLPEECAQRHTYSYLPFGGGQRICIGQKYAIMSLKVMITTALRHYRFHCDSKLEDIRVRFAIVLKPIGGHQVKITPRILKL